MKLVGSTTPLQQLWSKQLGKGDQQREKGYSRRVAPCYSGSGSSAHGLDQACEENLGSFGRRSPRYWEGMGGLGGLKTTASTGQKMADALGLYYIATLQGRFGLAGPQWGFLEGCARLVS